MVHLTRRQVVHLRPQTPRGESLAKPGTLLLTILSSVRKSDMQRIYGNFAIYYYKNRLVKATTLQGGCRQK